LIVVQRIALRRHLDREQEVGHRERVGRQLSVDEPHHKRVRLHTIASAVAAAYVRRRDQRASKHRSTKVQLQEVIQVARDELMDQPRPGPSAAADVTRRVLAGS